MFERFDDRARRVLVAAQHESRGMGHRVIDTDHILLGLIADETSIGGAALLAGGVTAETLRTKVDERHSGDKGSAGQAPPFTNEAKKSLELALRSALSLRDKFIGSQHLLLGILRQPNDPAVRQLADLGVNVPALHMAIADPAQLTAVGSDPAGLPLSRNVPPAIYLGPSEVDPYNRRVTLSPAADAIFREACRMPRSGPLGSHELLMALFKAPTSAAAQTLRALGITSDDVQRALEGIDIDGTTDAS